MLEILCVIFAIMLEIVRNGLEIILLIFLSFSFTKDESEFLLPQCYSVVSKAKDVRRFGYSQFGTITA